MDEIPEDIVRQEVCWAGIEVTTSAEVVRLEAPVYVEGPIGPIGPTGPTGPVGAPGEKIIILTTTHHQIEQEDYLLIRSPIPRVITLPAPITGREIVIKALASSGAHRILAPASSFINDHQPMYHLTSYTSVRFLAYENVWYTL